MNGQILYHQVNYLTLLTLTSCQNTTFRVPPMSLFQAKMQQNIAPDPAGENYNAFSDPPLSWGRCKVPSPDPAPFRDVVPAMLVDDTVHDHHNVVSLCNVLSSREFVTSAKKSRILTNFPKLKTFVKIRTKIR